MRFNTVASPFRDILKRSLSARQEDTVVNDGGDEALMAWSSGWWAKWALREVD